MVRNGWLLTVVVLAVAAWTLFVPEKLPPELTRTDLAGCYVGGGARLALRADGTMQAGGLEGLYHIAPGAHGSRPQAVVPDRIVARAEDGKLLFQLADGGDRWSIIGEQATWLSVVGVRMQRQHCEGALLDRLPPPASRHLSAGTENG